MSDKIKAFIQNLYCRYHDDEVPAMGAQLTYYLILSVFPFLLFLVALVGITTLTPDQILQELGRLVPASSNDTILGVLEEIQANSSQALLSIGMVATLWSASKGVDAVIKALNKAYDEEESRSFIIVKGLSVLFTLALACSILLAFFLLIFGQWIREQVALLLTLPDYFDEMWSFAQYAVSLAVLVLVFTMLYKYIPNRRLTFKEVLPGAFFSTIGWLVVSVLFSFYVNNFGNYTKTYGSIGGIIVLLIWLYLSSIIIILGGEINAALHFARNGRTKTTGKSFSLEIPFIKRQKTVNSHPDVIKPLYPHTNDDPDKSGKIRL